MRFEKSASDLMPLRAHAGSPTITQAFRCTLFHDQRSVVTISNRASTQVGTDLRLVIQSHPTLSYGTFSQCTLYLQF